MQHILDVQQGQTVLELGPGSGGALKAILNHGAKKVYAVEISEVFRNELNADAQCKEAVAANLLSIRGDDAKSLPFLPDKSVDRILGINVVYVRLHTISHTAARCEVLVPFVPVCASYPRHPRLCASVPRPAG